MPSKIRNRFTKQKFSTTKNPRKPLIISEHAWVIFAGQSYEQPVVEPQLVQT